MTRMKEPAIRMVRPLQVEYIVIGSVLMNIGNSIYSMPEEQFVRICMKHSNGSLNPNRVRLIYVQLLEEAGIPYVKQQQNQTE